MEIEYDPIKSERNARLRGLPFSVAYNLDWDDRKTKLEEWRAAADGSTLPWGKTSHAVFSQYSERDSRNKLAQGEAKGG